MIQLIHKKSGKVLLEIQNEQTLIHDITLKKIFETAGIAIPAFRRKEYGGQALIFVEDPHFSKALCEVFYPFELDPERYELVKS